MTYFFLVQTQSVLGSCDLVLSSAEFCIILQKCLLEIVPGKLSILLHLGRCKVYIVNTHITFCIQSISMKCETWRFDPMETGHPGSINSRQTLPSQQGSSKHVRISQTGHDTYHVIQWHPCNKFSLCVKKLYIHSNLQTSKCSFILTKSLQTPRWLRSLPESSGRGHDICSPRWARIPLKVQLALKVHHKLHISFNILLPASLK